MKYRVARNGQEIGEWTLEEITAQFQEGALRDTDLVWTAGMPTWVYLTQVLPAELLPPGLPVQAMAIPTVMPTTQLRPKRPESNLVWAILMTIFCCLPIGIVAIISASEVNSLYDSGRYEEAEDAAKKAWKWTKIGVIAWAVVVVLYMGFYGLVFLMTALGAR